jgi:predicted RNA-binding Zn ribbon-like protein
MDEKQKQLKNLGLLREKLCLDFVNTGHKFFHTFQDLIIWSQYVEILTDRDAQKLLQKAAKFPIEAEKILKQTIELQETLSRILTSVAQETVPSDNDLTIFNKYLSKAMAHSCIVTTEAGFSWDSGEDTETLDGILNPVIRSTADLLVSDTLKKLKMCANPSCRWFFWDGSRNQSRRWCDMKVCGNRAKARRFYQRKQKARSTNS